MNELHVRLNCSLKQQVPTFNEWRAWAKNKRKLFFSSILGFQMKLLHNILSFIIKFAVALEKES